LWGGFLIRWLSENKIKVGKVILVAPWLDPHHSKGKDNDFFKFALDKNLYKKTDKLSLFFSEDDDEDIQISVEKIINEIKNIKVKKFKNYGHFCFSDMKSEQFPELLKEII
jgi:predicted alpha/beta hydrolase family esterase